EEIEIRRSKEKRRLLGIIRWVGGGEGAGGGGAVELLATVGKVYEKRQDTPRGSASVAQDHQKDSFSLEKIFGHLTTLKKDMSNRIRFAIQELEDLRQNKWMPRGGEKGPKTIEEVREEVEKEHQENEMERIEHDKQKEREKMQQTSRKNTRPSYGGRSSADRRSAAAANATSLLTGRADSRISTMSKLSEVDSFSGLGGGRKRWDHPRDRTPQKEDSGLGPASAGGASGAGGGGGGTFSSETAWRSTSRGGTDSPKDSSGGHGAHGGGGGD
uniref:EIF4G1 n=1 Tax=Globodera pallida TaxID=36090 RepID=A0A183CGD5_GLOPA